MTRIPALMIQGTSSDAGKSLLVAGLARLFTRRGFRVKPFKPQNMSNNAAVTLDGGEIGRAQALQALACKIPAATDMNPILLKPQSEIGSQIIVQGKIWGQANAAEYHRLKKELLPFCLESFRRLSREADLILVEGAGSAAEVNLRQNDIANMGFAEAADLPVLMVGDIERGGVIAQLLGTFSLLSEGEKNRIKGFVVNKFRGDPQLFSEGMNFIAEQSGIPAIGLLPYFPRAREFPAEDGLGLRHYSENHKAAIKIAVPLLPHIANFDDLDPLRMEPDVSVKLIPAGEALPGDADLVLLPGSKATIADMAFFRECGWEVDLKAHVRRGGKVLGLCGGYQMLGKKITDPLSIEGIVDGIEGLGLLDIETELGPKKRLAKVEGMECTTRQPVHGYEIHLGESCGPDRRHPMIRLLNGKEEGALSADGAMMGCYMHGIFASDSFRHAFLSRLKTRESSQLQYEERIENLLDDWSIHLEKYLNINLISEIINVKS